MKRSDSEKGQEPEELLATGSRSRIYTTKYNENQAVIKTARTDSNATVVHDEARHLRTVNELNMGPELYAERDDAVVMEFVDGEPLQSYVGNGPLAPIVRSVLAKLRVLDEHGIDKGENMRPDEHVIVNKTVTLIDFERCRHTPTPQNVTQFLQFLYQEPVQDCLAQEGVTFDPESVIRTAKRYKGSYSEQQFHAILDSLGLAHL